MELHEIDALLSDASTRLGLEPLPVTPEQLAYPVSSREDSIARRNRSNQRKTDQWDAERNAYLEKVRRGRSVRGVDLNQPALSHQAEMLRQTEAITKANRGERYR